LSSCHAVKTNVENCYIVRNKSENLVVTGLIIRNSFDHNDLNISTDYDDIMM